MTAARRELPRRPRARRGEGDKLRAHILNAAEDLLATTGDEGAVSIRAVAKRAGITPPSIYMHFSDKNELLFEVCESRFAQFDERLEAAGAGSDDPFESLRLRARAYVSFGTENPEAYRILFMGRPTAAPDGYDPERLMRSASFAHLVDAVERCLVARPGVRREPIEVAMLLWAAIHGVTSLLISKPDFPWPGAEDLIDRLVEVQMAGLFGSATGRVV